MQIAPGLSHDTTPPTLSIATPLDGEWVSNGVITVSGSADDAGPNAPGLSAVTITLPSGYQVVANGTTNWSAQVGLSAGLNTISVTAADIANNVSSPVTVQVTYFPNRAPNDMFANSIALSGASGLVTGTNTDATKEFGEPLHGGNPGGKSVWWTYTPSVDGVLSLNTSNSMFDTLMGLYTGSAVNTLTTIAENDDAYPGAKGGFSAITQAVRSNITYSIAVDGYNAASGTIYLAYSFVPAPVFTVTASSTAGGFATPVSDVVQSNGTLVVTAVANQFYQLASWSGSVNAATNPLSIVVDHDMTVTANFTPVSVTDGFETGNFLHLPWVTGGDMPWFVETNVVDANHYSAQSGPIGNNQISWLSLTTNFQAGAGSFDFKVSSEADFDFLQFYEDGVMQAEWSGEQGWAHYQFNVPSGIHTLEWRYEKDPTGSAGLDAGFIDQVNLPLATASIAPGSAPSLKLIQQNNGSYVITLASQANQQYILQVSSDMLHWQNVSTNTASGASLQIVIPASSGPAQFYRTVSP